MKRQCNIKFDGAAAPKAFPRGEGAERSEADEGWRAPINLYIGFR